MSKYLTFVLAPAATGDVVIQGFFDLNFGIQLLQGPGNWVNFGSAGMTLSNNIGAYPAQDGDTLFTMNIRGPRSTNQRITLQFQQGQQGYYPRTLPNNVHGPLLADGQFDEP